MNRAQPFSYSQTQLEALSQRVLTLAQQEGATAAEVEVSESQGQNVSVRLSEVETLEYTPFRDGPVHYCPGAESTPSLAVACGERTDL